MPERPEPAVAPVVVEGGAARMAERLAEIAARSDDENPIIGTRRLREVRTRLATLPSDVAAARRGELRVLLAHLEMWEGNIDRAIELLSAARKDLEELPPEGLRERRDAVLFWLAVAHLRSGEAKNCLADHTPASCILPLTPEGVHRDPEAAKRALAIFSELAASSEPGAWLHDSSRWLANISAMAAGRHPEGVALSQRIEFESVEDFPRFRDVAGAVGVDAFDLCGGAVVDDFDGDGWLDIVSSTWDPKGALHFFRNQGDGRFADVTDAAGLTGVLGGLNLIHGDYDGDGDLDLFVLRGAWLRGAGRHPNSLLRNDGQGVFEDVTLSAGLGAVDYPTSTAAFADFDRDGDLDLYVGNEAYDSDQPAARFPNQLFRNEGDGRFTDVAAWAGVENHRFTKGVTWGDYDGDGDPDLYVSNLDDANRLYRNDGAAGFTDVAPTLGVTGPHASFSTWFWDFDNDGALDLLVNPYAPEGGGNLEVPELAAVVASHLGEPSVGETPRLYRGDGRGGFEDVSAAQGLTLATLPMGANFGDIDGDGFLDFYLGTGYPGYEGLIPNILYRNRRGAGFVDVTYAAGMGHLQKGHGTAFADFDGDGDQDVYQQVGGFFRGDGYRNVLFANRSRGQRMAVVVLHGADANRFGVGARVRVEIEEDGVRRSIHRHVGSTGSFGGNPHRQEIGVGSATRIEALEVTWPRTGRTQRFERLDLGEIHIIEDEDVVEHRLRKRVPFARAPARADASHHGE
ncbi:MAG: VCBS repeat-containing protein [Deltaproteobacteria bacterium]|nr:VCBS repeat-containing protein [Deltaproteobacteria bacterium]